jgi:hypothetical protein
MDERRSFVQANCIIFKHNFATLQDSERQWLAGSSTLAFEDTWPEHMPAMVMDVAEQVVVPFFTMNTTFLPDADEASVLALYRWALGAVAAYSFELGDDKLQVRKLDCSATTLLFTTFHEVGMLADSCLCLQAWNVTHAAGRTNFVAFVQGMVPMFDALNHITGCANVRLHHDTKLGALQMITTCLVPSGAELVNSYGDNMSSGQLLHRCAVRCVLCAATDQACVH